MSQENLLYKAIKIKVAFVLTIFTVNLSAQTYTLHDTLDGIPEASVTDIITDKSGNIWVSTHGGVLRYSNLNWTLFELGNNNPSTSFQNVSNSITSIGDTIWIATEINGLWRINPDDSMVNYQMGVFGMPSSSFYCIAADSKGVLWAGMKNPSNSSLPDLGLIRFDGKQFTAYNINNSNIGLTQVYSISIDDFDNIWMVGEYLKRIPRQYGGAVMFNGNTFKHFNTTNSSLPTNHTFGVLCSPNKPTVFYSHELGISEIDSNGLLQTFSNDFLKGELLDYSYSYNRPMSILGNNLFSFIKNKDNRNIISLLNLEDYTISSYSEDDHPFIKYGYISTFADTKSSSIWFGNYGQILEMKFPNAISEYKFENSAFYPNPTSGVVHLKNELNISELEIYSVFGQHVMNIKNNYNGEIDLTTLPSGTYILVLVNTTDQQIKKLIQIGK